MDEKVMLPCEHGKFGLHNLYFESGELDREPCLGGRVVEGITEAFTEMYEEIGTLGHGYKESWVAVAAALGVDNE